MPDSTPEIPPFTIYAQAWAVRLGFAVVAAFVVILGFVLFDNAHRPELETVSATTAVGDARYFQAPADATRLPAVGATLDGKPLYVADLTPIDVRDTRTHRVGSDDARGLAIYELAASASDAERERVGSQRRAFLLKVGPDRWVIARPAEDK